ncbi:unnamed protein product [Alopecurus aequalis]
MPPPPPTLPDELIEEIFLRLPPNEPARLVRASLASKLWLGILTGARFRGLYRDLHGAPPMLGFIYSCPQDDLPKPEDEEEDNNLPNFVATAKFGVRIPAVEDWRGWHRDYTAWDCRHGRVLYCKTDVIPMPLVVWDPMTGRRRLMYAPEDYDTSGAAVFCNDPGCDHRDCHGGPFQVVYVGLYNGDGGSVAYAMVSLPEIGKWSESCPALDLAIEDAFIVDKPPVCIQDAFYFMLTYEYDDDNGGHDNIAILKYELGSNCLSLIHAPPAKTGLAGDAVIMAMEEGCLGFAHVDGLTLKLWSWHIGSKGVMTWTCSRVIDLKILRPIQNPKEKLRLIGSVEYNDIIFMSIDLGIYKINLKSLRSKKIWKREQCRALFPYMSFYNPPERASLSDVAH